MIPVQIAIVCPEMPLNCFGVIQGIVFGNTIGRLEGSYIVSPAAKTLEKPLPRRIPNWCTQPSTGESDRFPGGNELMHRFPVLSVFRQDAVNDCSDVLHESASRSSAASKGFERCPTLFLASSGAESIAAAA